jgi:RND family efflux transporter MFP subunit
MMVSGKFFVSTLLLWLLACACNRGGDPAGEEAQGSRPVRVTCAPVTAGTATDTVEIRGTVAPPPDRDALVAPQVAGRLLRVEVQEGDAVKVGQIVARVDTSVLADEATQADAALDRARAERRNAKSTLVRTEQVFDRGIAARQEVDDAAAREAEATADEASATARARQAHQQIKRAAVRSPMTGVVLRILRKPGELVDGTPATPVVEIADTSVLELVADTPTQDLVRLERGAPAVLAFPAMPGRSLEGMVSRVAPAVDRSTGLGAVRVSIEDTDAVRLPVGTYGVASVSSGAPHAVMLVPSIAVRSSAGGGSEVVVCGKDKRAHVVKVKVRPGAARDSLVEVDGALGPADRVSVDPVIGLSDGETIGVRP